MEHLVGVVPSILQFIGDISKEPKRIVWIVFMVLLMSVLLGAIALFVAWVSEASYAANYYQNLEQKIDLIKSLNELEKDGIRSRPELSRVYDQTIIELSLREIRPTLLPPILIPTIPMMDQITIYKTISGAFVGLLFFLIALLFVRQGQKEIIKGTVIVTVVFGTIGAILPTFIAPVVNIVVLPILELVALYIYGGWKTQNGTKGQSNRTPIAS